MKSLEAMASEVVGDGKSPNIFFVSNSRAKVTAIIKSRIAAIDFAVATGAYLVEDRLTGVVWGSPAFEALHRVDDD